MEKCQSYIVERIVSSHKQELCFHGMLAVQELPACLCPPLSLCQAEVVMIQTVGRCWHEKATEQLVLTLLCRVIDQHGRRAEGIAQIKLEACAGHRAGNVRRGARIRIEQACFCGSNAFQVKAAVCVHTVVSCCEMVVNPKQCKRTCPQLPLYPPVPQRGKGKKRQSF